MHLKRGRCRCGSRYRASKSRMSIIKPITSKVMSLADYEYIYPVVDTMQGRARAPPHRPTLHSQTILYRPGIARAMRGQPAGLRHTQVDQGDRQQVVQQICLREGAPGLEPRGATSRVREQWRQRVQAPPKQLITTQRPVYLNTNLAFLKATTTNILT